ncbi:hypothetical protein SEA_CONLEY_79 [Gordonia phage Conley]|nr:hypothetical protein SEA_CONLEY_79 [Gordonia phage Conley]
MSNCQSVSLETSRNSGDPEPSIFDRSMVKLTAVLTCACGHKTVTTANVRQDVLMRPDLLARADRLVHETAMDLQALHEEKMMGR